ncbi:hypothetical protein ACFV1W_31800 [Kitasatospora sp. NPDC059648]|uniref:hypothetical protein n=1 Tax=Kitasatospora sp. NPDC059648 TaxID=3346894 RepID=UPI0036897ABE
MRQTHLACHLIGANVAQDTILCPVLRRSLRGSLRDLLLTGAEPLLGGLGLSAVLLQTLTDAWSPVYGNGAVFGIGSVLVIGVGILLLDAGPMTWYGPVRPEFFRGETLQQGHPRPGGGGLTLSLEP